MSMLSVKVSVQPQDARAVRWTMVSALKEPIYGIALDESMTTIQ